MLKVNFAALALGLIGCASFSPTVAPKQFVMEKRWIRETTEKMPTGYRLIERMAPISYQSWVIQGNSTDGLVAVDQKTGNLHWRTRLEGGVEADAVLRDAKIYLGTKGGIFVSINADDGKINWSFPTRFEVLSAPAVVDGVVYFLAGNNTLYALSAQTGQKLWSYSRPETSILSIRGGSQPVVHGDVVYAGFSDGALVALKSKTGALQWEVQLSKAGRFKDVDATPVIDGSTLFVSNFDGALYGLSLSDGKIQWKVDEGGVTPITVLGEKMFYATTSGKMMALDKKSGKTLWSVPVKRGIATQPVPFRGLLAYGESDGALKVVDQSDGRTVAAYSPGRGVFASPLVDEKTGDLFFVSNEGNLYAMKLSWRQAFATWP